MFSLPTYRWLFSAGLLLFCLLPCDAAAQQAELERLWSGLVGAQPISDIAVKDDAGYVVSERGLEIYDLSPSPELRLHATLEIIPHTEPRARLADDTLLLIWDADTGISLFSVSRPLQPQFLKHIRLRGLHDADAQGGQLFAAWPDRDTPVVRQIDWTMPGEPTTDVMASLNGFRKVIVSGRYVYGLGYGPDNDWITVARVVQGGTAESLGFIEPEWLFVQDIAARDSVLYVLPTGSQRPGHKQGIIEYGINPNGTWTWYREYETPEEYRVESMVLEENNFLLAAQHNQPSLPPWQAERTIIIARIGEENSLEYKDTLGIGLARDDMNTSWSAQGQYHEYPFDLAYAVNGSRLLWRSYVSIGTAMLANSRIKRTGDKVVGMRCYDVAGFDREHVFAVTTDTLFGMDFSDPRNPVILSRTPLRAEGAAMMSEDRLITFDSVVTLFDVSDAHSPRLLDTLHLGEGRIAWEAETNDSVIVLCCLEKGAVVLLMSEDRLYRACEIGADATDALWTERGLLLTTLDGSAEAWEPYQVNDSRYEWCSPDRLKVWGRKGQSIMQTGDTAVIAAENTVLFTGITSSGQFPPNVDFSYEASKSSDAWITQALYHGDLLFIQFSNNYKNLYVGQPDGLGIQQIGSWMGLYEGTGRFFFDDSLTMFLVGPIFGLEAFRFTLPTLSTPVPLDEMAMPSLHLLPNPARDVAFLEIYSPPRGNSRVGLYTLQGKKIQDILSGEFEPGLHRVALQTTSLPPGTYWLRLEDEEGRTAAAPLHIVR